MEATIKQTVRLLRKEQTSSERIFWHLVRNRRLDGKKFMRQHALKFEYMINKKNTMK